MNCEKCNGRCCNFVQYKIDFWMWDNNKLKDFTKHVEVWGGAYKIKPKLLGILNRIYVIHYSPCKQLNEQGKCKVYNQRPQICKDYDCETDEFMPQKEKLLKEKQGEK